MSFAPFFVGAARSPGRQRAFRQVAAFHLGLLLTGWWVARSLAPRYAALTLGHVLLIAGIIEGAVLLGWRLAQLPKSQALEFLLVSQLQPRRVFAAEALVGLTRLALVTLTGLPVLVVLARDGLLLPDDVPPLLLSPFVCGAITGLGLSAWAYEAPAVRRWGERLLLAAVVLYLAVGVLAAERLGTWLGGAEKNVWQVLALEGFKALHVYNPFGIVQHWLERYGTSAAESQAALQQMAALVAAGGLVAVLLLLRAAGRLKAHFHERHYRPAVDASRGGRGRIGDSPLSWWAVRRVMEYSGRANLWLAGGFGLLYAAYHVASATGGWPPWLGRRVFELVERAGGVPAVTAGLVVLAAVPAAFQYGLWDGNAHDRCRRLELLLLTGLEARDYWQAAAAAAWRRGRGYFGIAIILCLAQVLARPAAPGAAVLRAAATLAAGVILWGFCFAVGFRAFARGLHANHLGLTLSVGLPAMAVALAWSGWASWAYLLPPGSVYGAAAGHVSLVWLPGPVLAAAAALAFARTAQAHCLDDLRAWYSAHHGRAVQD